jgi:hypothetical protein
MRVVSLAGLVAAWLAISAPGLSGQAFDPAVAARSRQALAALDRYLETWNSRNAALWATSLHFPHVRPGAGAFEVSRTREEYAAGVNFEQTLRTGWHHSEWVSRDVLQVGEDKIHVAGSWERFTAAGQSQTTSAITYIVTNREGRWGIQARFAAGTGTIDTAAAARNGAAATAAIDEYVRAWNSHDPAAMAKAVHYPHVNIADGQVDVWATPEALLAGPEPGRQRTWYRLRVDAAKIVQVTATGVNATLTLNRLGRDGRMLSHSDAVFLVVLRDGVWKLQARSVI